MGKRYGILIVSVTILVLCFVGTASATNWSVDGSGGADFTGIQEAINNASVGDTILVYSDVYYENVVVDKSVTLKGIGYPIVDARRSGSAIRLTVDEITLVGFNITKGSGGGAGIKIRSSNNTITGNNASNNMFGIALFDSSNNTITGNNASNNGWNGIRLDYSSNNIITGNNVSNNDKSIFLDRNSSNNIITGNNVSNNSYSIYLKYSSNNTIYLNNFINNTDNVYSSKSTNIWNSPEEITYTYDGNAYKSYLGNYWEDYRGIDADEDGIGDTPYQIDGDRDNYPLMELCEKYFALPMPGEWRGSAEFGEFVFIVNNNSTGISKISYNFSNWTCGPTRISGGVSISTTRDWPITSGQFSIETNVGGWPGRLPMTIRGKFDEIGTHASGNWEAVSSEVTCSGAWDADYNSNEKSNT